MPSHSASAVHCDGCDRRLGSGEVYYETTTAKLTVGAPPPMYAAKTRTCEACDGKDDREREALDRALRHVLEDVGDVGELTERSHKALDALREVQEPVGCPCVGTTDQEHCPHD